MWLYTKISDFWFAQIGNHDHHDVDDDDDFGEQVIRKKILKNVLEVNVVQKCTYYTTTYLCT